MTIERIKILTSYSRIYVGGPQEKKACTRWLDENNMEYAQWDNGVIDVSAAPNLRYKNNMYWHQDLQLPLPFKPFKDLLHLQKALEDKISKNNERIRIVMELRGINNINEQEIDSWSRP